MRFLVIRTAQAIVSIWGALTIVFVNVETPRFRGPIDPFLVLLAGCALEAGLQRLRVRGARGRRRVRSATPVGA